MVDEIDEAQHMLTVFARAADLPPRTLRQRFEQTTGRVPLDFALFPRELELVDVYVTNAPSIGLVRHLYF
ncbi:MAG: hypothetical protein H6721_14775 [Sandaracinus sp.]|nr:hypothetical protein [Myxococcales bacterium]MCB9633376.1 hypothetical protein [Sandaracinus sp.]